MIGVKTTEVEDFWKHQRDALDIKTDQYFAGTFADPRFATYHDELIELVGRGLKRATAHLALDFERNDIARRDVGDYWVVLMTSNEPRYLIRITDVDVRPFDKVEQSFAEREGEGDSSLRYWRKVHQDYFESQCLEWGVPWHSGLDTVCEGFELLAKR